MVHLGWCQMTCKDLIEAYVEWFKKRIKVDSIEGICEITTPFIDRHNDQLQIYVKRAKDKLKLTDDGYILKDLQLQGFDIRSEKRQMIIRSILLGFGAHLEQNEIVIEATPENFPEKKHNLIQTMLSINDMFVMSQPMVASVFREDVESYLKKNKVRYTPYVRFTGKSGFTEYFDFAIPQSPKKPERILRAINNPDRQNVIMFIFAWLDIREFRPRKSSALGILNDHDRDVSTDAISALTEYGIKFILWSERKKYIDELID